MRHTWTYPAVFETHLDGEILVRFPDFPEALTGADTQAGAMSLAADALEAVVLAYLADGRAVPTPGAAGAGQVAVALDPTTAARAALAETMRTQRVTHAALARRMDRTEGAVRRLTNGAASVKIETVLDALATLGRRATLSV